jgi:hypothetical protein
MMTSGAFGYLGDYALWWVLCLSLVIHTWCFFKFFPTKKYRKSGLVIGNVLVLACLLGVAALVGESYYRFLCVETDSFGMSLPAQRWFVLYTDLNSSNFRDEEWTKEKPAGTRRIAFVGDSFTYGWGIEREEDRFPDRTEGMLNARLADSTPPRLKPWATQVVRTADTAVAHSDAPNRNPNQNHHRNQSRDSHGADTTGDADQSRDGHGAVGSPCVEVMNVAKPGWDSGAELEAIREMIEVYDWDEVVLCYVPNDIEELLPRSESFDPISPPQPRWINPTTSCLFEHLYYTIWVPRVATVSRYHDWLAAGFADDSLWQAHQDQLSGIIQECQDHDVTLRIVLLPFHRVSGKAFQSERIHAMVRAFFEARHVQVLDLLPVVAGIDPADLIVNSHDAHPNEHANALYAEAIWETFYR